MSKLPSGYTKLAYIQSTGTQYVDSGLVVNKSDNYEYTITAQFSNDAYGGANGYMQFKSGIANGTKAEIKVVYDGTTHVESVYVNGVLNSSTDWTDSYNGANVKIGVLKMGDINNGWFSGEAQIGKVYSQQIKKSGALVRNFQPCIDSSGAVGLYDLVSQQFYGNAGTGVFTTGPEIAQPPAAPGNFRQTAKDYFSMSLAWDSVSDATGYKLYRDGTLLATLSETGYTDTGLWPNTAYTYTVTGINAESEGDPATLTAKTKEGFAVEPNLITDRTQEDVLSLLSAIARIESGTGTAEDASLIKQTGNKGAYNFTDLNRVGAAVSYISGIITGTGYDSAVSPKTDWMESDKPTEAQLNQYLADVETLRNGMVGILNSYAAESAYPLPEVPTDMLGLTYQEANDIETILLHIYKQIRYMSDHMYWVHSNDVYSGEV